MPVENFQLSALTEFLDREHRVWVRLAATRPETDWRLALLEITLGQRPPTWRRQRWLYPRAAFIASMPAGSTVAKWLQRGRLSLRPISLDLNIHNSVNLERRDSGFAGIFEPLPWPTQVWTVSLNGQSNTTVHDELVAADTPAFFGFEQAAASFFAVAPTTHRNFSGQHITVRAQDPRARIDSVLLRTTELIVTVSGDELGGTYLTLGGDGAPRERLSSQSREVHLPTPSGLGPGAWLALHRDDELLDRRILDPAWGGKDFEVERDATTMVQALISAGEGISTEFKRQLPEGKPDPVMKTIAAFANGQGGTIVFGVDDDGQPVGLTDKDLNAARDRMTNLINHWVRPRVNFHPETVLVNTATLLLVRVTAGTTPPYGIGTSDDKVVYYIRRAATTFPATPADVQVVVLSRVPTPGPLFPPGRR